MNNAAEAKAWDAGGVGTNQIPRISQRCGGICVGSRPVGPSDWLPSPPRDSGAPTEVTWTEHVTDAHARRGGDISLFLFLVVSYLYLPSIHSSSGLPPASITARHLYWFIVFSPELRLAFTKTWLHNLLPHLQYPSPLATSLTPAKSHQCGQ